MRPVTEEQRIDIAVQLREFQARASRAGRNVAPRSCRRLLPSQASADKSITFPPGLSNDDRAVVHAECRKARPRALCSARRVMRLAHCGADARWRLQLGFTSKSHGKGPTRAVTVSKARRGLARSRNAASACQT
jgi:hypothetical protein